MGGDNALTPVAVMDRVERRYGNRVIFQDLTFEVMPGEMVAIVGPSGSGKSTLLNGIGLLEPFSAGRVRLFGQSAPRPGSSRARRLLRDKIGYRFQNYALIDNHSVRANLELAAKAAKLPRGTRRSVIAQALIRVGLSAAVDPRRRVYSLSGGEQQRVAVARLLVKRCELVLADEPTGSLDRANADAVVSLLRAMADNGIAVVILTHDPHLAAACDRTIVLAGPSAVT